MHYREKYVFLVFMIEIYSTIHQKQTQILYYLFILHDCYSDGATMYFDISVLLNVYILFEAMGR